ncbi:hypothetical protein [Polaromonas sp.]|uniref:hypothetical protein n=1 Tax=Polaromonas sp. TaxID=1869339 RepID=UPI003CC5F3D1
MGWTFAAVLAVFMGVIGQSASAAAPCAKAAPETVNQFLEGLTNGSIQLADRIDLPFHSEYLYCPNGGKPGNTCFSTGCAGYVNLVPLKTTRAESHIQQIAGTFGKEAIANMIASLEQSGLRHASLGQAKVRTAVLKRGGVQIRLYTPADEWFATYEGRRSENCIRLKTEFERSSKELKDDGEEYRPAFPPLPKSLPEPRGLEGTWSWIEMECDLRRNLNADCKEKEKEIETDSITLYAFKGRLCGHWESKRASDAGSFGGYVMGSVSPNGSARIQKSWGVSLRDGERSAELPSINWAPADTYRMSNKRLVRSDNTRYFYESLPDADERNTFIQDEKAFYDQCMKSR